MTRAVWRLDRRGDGYPECVDQLAERAPATLWGLGDRALVAGLNPDASVTIVGARRSGRYGTGIAYELGYGAAVAGLIVVSGMALGCDSAAHEGALDAGGTTIAVLGNGPDVPYPRVKAGLHRRILRSGGAVIAEQPPGQAPQPGFFPARNRIMAALAGVSIVVEGAIRSGTRYTADEAGELGRQVAAVPGPVTSGLAALPNDLLHSGAAVIRDTQDLLDLMLGAGIVSVRDVGPALEPELAAALAAVEDGATTCDAIAQAVGLSGHAAAVALARLELTGYLAADHAGRYSRTVLRPPDEAEGGEEAGLQPPLPPAA